MKSKTVVINKKAIATVVIAVILLLLGWFVGYITLRCKCDGNCCSPKDNKDNSNVSALYSP